MKFGLFTIAFALGAELVLYYLLAVLASEENPWSKAVIIYALVQGAAILLWIKNQIMGWSWFYLGGRDYHASRMAQTIRDMGFRRAEAGESELQDYLLRMADDPGEEERLRRKAAYEAGTLAGISSVGFMSTTRVALLGNKVMRHLRQR